MDTTTAPPAAPEASGAAGQPAGRPPEDRRTRIGRYVALFVMPFLMVTMMYASYVGTMHEPTPDHVPVAVVGSGPAAEAVVAALDDAPGGAVDARLVGRADEAADLLRDQEVAGVLEIPAGSGEGGKAVVTTASAGGASQASTVKQLLAPVTVEQGWDVETRDAAPLPDGDMAGIAVLFAAMGMMLAGYVPLSVLTMSMPYLLSVRRFLPLVAGWSFLTSSVIWLILGPLVGAVDGHYLQFVGVGMLATMAVGCAQMLFTKLVGPLAVLFGMLLWVCFGMPSSNLALSVHTMPGFFQWLHGVLPLPAAGESLRALLYFDGRGVGGHLIALGVWLVAALALALLKERKGHLIPAAPPVTDGGTPLPALAGGPVRPLWMRRFAAIAFPLSILVMVVGLMGASMHKPQIHDMPVAVVGASTQQAEQVTAALEPKLGGMLELSSGDSVDEARESVLDQEIVGAYVLPTERGGPATLLTSSAAGNSQHMALGQMFQQIAAASKTPLKTEDVKPLTGHDTMGSNSMYVGMAWIMAGFLLMAVLRGGAPELTRTRRILPFQAGWAIGISAWLWLLFDVMIGAIDVPAWEFIAYGSLSVLSVSLATAVFTRTVGLAAIVPVMVVMMLAGVPASGGGMSIYMVPEIFGHLKDVLPLPATVDIARSMVYFDGHGIGRNLLTIGIWGAAGLALNFLVDLWLKRRERRAAPPAGDGAPAAGAVGTVEGDGRGAATGPDAGAEARDGRETGGGTGGGLPEPEPAVAH
ncbi:ABC transporter permease [Streptomyces sp. NPDC002734]|uniref:ABC transporter permease n=1 Tax=Streptomyces sp. NPDC002734 TaxID=3154426 RepID=UPI00332577C7